MSFPVPLPSTFMPLPLAIMIPFMGIQSGVMAQQFGMNFQYGKRKISAMSNEEFNKLTPAGMQADFSTQIKGMIPTFEKSLQDMRPFQRMIFVEMIAAFKEAVDLGLDVARAGLGIPPSVGDIGKNADPNRFQPPQVPQVPSTTTKRPTDTGLPSGVTNAMLGLFKGVRFHDARVQEMNKRIPSASPRIKPKLMKDLQSSFNQLGNVLRIIKNKGWFLELKIWQEFILNREGKYP